MLPNILAQNNQGQTIFHVLIQKLYLTKNPKFAKIFKTLIEHPDNIPIVQQSINITNNNGYSIIHLLCMYNLHYIIRLLIVNRIRIPLLINNNNETPIFWLSKFNHNTPDNQLESYQNAKISILIQFLDLPYFNPRDLLIQTHETEDEESEMFLSNVVKNFPDNLIVKFIKILVHKIPDNQIIQEIFTLSKDHQNSNLLIIAIQHQKFKTIQKILDLKIIDVNQPSQYQTTPLHLALLSITNNINYPHLLFMLLKEPTLNLSTVIYYNENTISHWCAKGLSPYCVDILRYMVQNNLLDVTIESVTKNKRIIGKTFTKLPFNSEQRNAYDLVKIYKNHAVMSYQSGDHSAKFRYDNIIMVEKYFQCIINNNKHKNETLRIDQFGQYYGNSTILQQTTQANNHKKRSVAIATPGIFNITGLADNLFNPKFCFDSKSCRKSRRKSRRKRSTGRKRDI